MPSQTAGPGPRLGGAASCSRNASVQGNSPSCALGSDNRIYLKNRVGWVEMAAKPSLLANGGGVGISPEHLQALARSGVATMPTLLAEASASVAQKSGIKESDIKSLKSRSIAASASCLQRGDDLAAMVHQTLHAHSSGTMAPRCIIYFFKVSVSQNRCRSPHSA